MDSDYLTISSVEKSYDGLVNAVDNISINIAKGEFLTLLGPSGSGKTTTLVMIAGFEQPSAGEIRIDGRDLTRLKPWERNIGMVFQNYALFPHMTIEKNIGFPLKMRGISATQAKRKVNSVLELVGLGEYGQRYPRELSGGQQQRVALARGIVFDPDVLLLDEPLGALDKNLREQMQVEIKRIHREVGITMIYVTHDQTEAMTMSDSVAVFNEGRIEQIAKPLDIYHQPASRFVGEFVGDSNFFVGKAPDERSGTISLDELGEIRVAKSKLSSAGNCSKYDVMIRPERVQLAPNSKTNGMNIFEMKVASTVNYGNSIILLGMINGKVPIRVRVSGEQWFDSMEGEIVKIGWTADDAHLIPAS
jgi:putative spermidine/putrescine transport system ATP-binding protein